MYTTWPKIFEQSRILMKNTIFVRKLNNSCLNYFEMIVDTSEVSGFPWSPSMPRPVGDVNPNPSGV